MNPATFASIHERFRHQYLGLPWNQRDQLDRLILEASTQFLHGMQEEDFRWLIEQREEDQLIHAIVPSVTDFLPRVNPGGFGGIPQELAVLGLSVMLVHWICSGSGSTRWRTPFSNLIPDAVLKRLKAMAEAEEQQSFYDGVGTPVEPQAEDAQPRRNPTESGSDRIDLTPEVKVNLLQNEIDALNERVITTPDGVARRGCLKYHSRSLEAARRFFCVNPEVSAGDIASIMANSLEVLEEPPPSASEEDTNRHLRKCCNLSYLLQLLGPVLKEYGLELPVDRYLSKAELFGKDFDPKKVRGIDHPHRPPLFVG